MENQTKLNWHQNPTNIILLLIFFFPAGLYFMWKNELWSKQTRWIISGVIALFIIANANFNKVKSSNSAKTNISSTELSSSISTKTFNSGYYYLYFKDDNTIDIYQKTSSSVSARGCAADGTWSIENGKVKIQVVKSYCGTETYSKFNGLYDIKESCIENQQFSFCNN